MVFIIIFFLSAKKSRIIINLNEGNGWDTPTQTYIKKVNDSTFEGYRYSKGWAKDQKEYFSQWLFLNLFLSFFILMRHKKFHSLKEKGIRGKSDL